MNKSALQLEHYTLSEISIKPNEGYVAREGVPYPSFNDADFNSAVEFGPASRDGAEPGSLWGIRLSLSCQAKEGGNFPYRFAVGIAGVLDGSGLPEANRSNLVLVNGTSLLYGALRDEVLRLTSRMDYGPLMLPTVQFAKLAEEAPHTEAVEAKSVPKKRVAKAKA